MSENLHDIDRLFRDSIDEGEEMPPPEVWNELDKQLDKRKVASIAGKYHVMKWVAAALFLISIGMAMYVYRVNRTAPYATAGKKSPATSALPRPSSEKDLQRVPVTANNKKDAQSGGLSALRADSQAITLPLNTANGAPGVAVNTTTPTGPATAATRKNEKEPVTVQDNRSSPSVVNPLIARSGVQPASARQRDNTSAKSDRLIKKRLSESVFAADTKGGISGEDQPGTAAAAGTREILSAPVASAPVVRPQADPGAGIPPFKVGRILRDSLATAASAVIKLSQQHQQRLTVTVFYAPSVVSSHVRNTDDFWGSTPRPREEDARQVKEKEANGASWSAGALFDYRFSNHWSIGSGLIMTTRITEIRPKLIFGYADLQGNVKYRFNCSSGYSYIDMKGNQAGGPISTAGRDTAQAVSSTNKLQYLSVPLVMKYHFGEGKIQFYTGFGFQGNFLVKRNIEAYITKGNNHVYANTSEIQGLRSFYLSGILTAGATYQVSPAVGISLMPNAQLGIMSINQHAPVKSYVSFYGLGAGVSIKL